MPPIILKPGGTDFDVINDDFASLEIHETPTSGTLHYFYHKTDRRLIKDFILHKGPQVWLMCGVTLIKKDGEGYSPRLKIWKQNNTKAALNEPVETLEADDPRLRVKASVDTGEGHEAFWALVHFIQTFQGIDLPPSEFQLATKDQVELARALDGHDKPAVLEAVRAHLGADLTEADVRLLAGRREQLETFRRLLDDPDFFEAKRIEHNKKGDELLWQFFFERNAWIFGYGLTLLSCESVDGGKLERMTAGSDVFRGAGKESDVLMETRGLIGSLLFGEIKTHDKTKLLHHKAYREPDTFMPSSALVGAVSQVRKTAHKAIRKLEDLHRLEKPDGTPLHDVLTLKPRMVVVAGSLDQLMADGKFNTQKLIDFELYRRGQSGIEILTFDEVYERAKFIVSDLPD